MKSKVESRSMCRARSERKIAAPFSTPTRMTDSPPKSFVICAPSSPTRFAISCREISTLSSVMAFHIKLRNVACTTRVAPVRRCPGFLCDSANTRRSLRSKCFTAESAKKGREACRETTLRLLEHQQTRISFYESQRPQTHVVRTCNFPYRDPGWKDRHYRSLGH